MSSHNLRRKFPAYQRMLSIAATSIVIFTFGSLTVNPTAQATTHPSEAETIPVNQALETPDEGTPFTPEHLEDLAQFVGIDPLSDPPPRWAWCLALHGAVACAIARDAGQQAEHQTNILFPVSERIDGRGDAFRHCYWLARMTIRLGAAEADRIGVNHEDFTTGNRPLQRTMDILNNRIGITIGQSLRTYAGSHAECLRRARNDELYTIVNGQLTRNRIVIHAAVLDDEFGVVVER